MGLLALYDDEFAVVWVVNMLAHQGRGANIAKHVGAHLLTLHNCPLIKDFLSRYEEMEIPYSNPLRTPFDGGVPQEQEQEQEQEQIQEQDPPSPPRGNGAVNRIFDQWVSIMGKNPKQAKLTPKRKRLVEARLAEGYTEQMLLEAIRGCQRSDHHMGNNERNRVYNSLELICRDGEHVEQFLDDQSGLSKGVKVSSARMLWNRNQEEDNGDPI